MKKTSILIFIIVISIVSVFAEQAYTPQTCGGINGMMSGYYGSGFVIIGWITYILVILLIIAGIYWLFTNAKGRLK
ncbi:hypothetical protein J4218_01320 [Candidatus Pacearchaeota archaeon]|nr:hypothetical protein [Candidatus Pacearchaeota archaeon]